MRRHKTEGGKKLGLTMEKVAGSKRNKGTYVAVAEDAARRLTSRAARLAIPGFLMMSIALPADAASLYRYINDKGYQEIGYSVPNHLVPNGYDVIDESGRLVRRVAAQLSEEDYAAKLERERKLEACENALARVHRRYESPQDIDKAERQFEAQREESLQNYQSTLEITQAELEKAQQQAASYEREGKQINVNVLATIDQTKTTIANLEAQIEQNRRSGLTQAETFDEERRVFQLNGCNEEQLAQANW